MHADFWLEKWQKGETGFHLAETHPLLDRHWPRLGVPADTPVFVPLCGKSRDLLHLRERGHPVTGIELSPLAIEQFLAEQGLRATPGMVGELPAHEVGDLRLIVGDFFDLRPADLGRIGAVYDRAALIALPPTLQTRYARRLLELLGTPRPMLLITLDYDPAEMQGPPFATPEARILELYGEHYRVEALECLNALDDNPALRQRGLSRLTETAWRLEPR